MARWKTFEPGFPVEERERLEKLAAMERFWLGFPPKEWMPWMRQNLDPLSPDLMWEIGPGRVVITPESSRHLRPMVDELMSRAPRLAGWRFLSYRPAEELDTARGLIQARTGEPWTPLGFKLEPGDHHLVDVTFYHTEPDDIARDQAFVAIETLLGEEVLDHWIGIIAVDSGQGQPLEEFQEAVKPYLQSGKSCSDLAEDSPWSLWELHPEQRADYPRQEDLFVGKSVLPDAWMCAHSGTRFWSGRFTPTEQLGYLKIDGIDGLAGYTDKAEIEEAVDMALAEVDAGWLVGGGTGLRYAYLDLALKDLSKAIPALRQTLTRGRIPRRSWLLFNDDEWASEWVGMYAETPPPP